MCTQFGFAEDLASLRQLGQLVRGVFGVEPPMIHGVQISEASHLMVHDFNRLGIVVTTPGVNPLAMKCIFVASPTGFKKKKKKTAQVTRMLRHSL